MRTKCNIVSGRDVMKAFKLSPGPLVGTILKELKSWEESYNHHVTKEMAFGYIRKNIKLREKV